MPVCVCMCARVYVGTCMHRYVCVYACAPVCRYIMCVCVSVFLFASLCSQQPHPLWEARLQGHNPCAQHRKQDKRNAHKIQSEVKASRERWAKVQGWGQQEGE